MRTRMIQHGRDSSSLRQPWLDVESLAQGEITSEDPACPIEAALIPGTPPGWRASPLVSRSSGSCLIGPNRCTVCGSYSPKNSTRVPRSSSCGGPPTGGSPTGRSCVSSIPLALQGPCTRSKTIRCLSTASRTSRDASCQTSRVATRVPPWRNCVSCNARWCVRCTSRTREVRGGIADQVNGLIGHF